MFPKKKNSKLNLIVAVLILLIGILIGGYLVLKSKAGTASIGEQLSQILEKDKRPDSDCRADTSDPKKDSDNDGLKDWEEAIWGTDPCRADSDGDGYLDGEEVASGYDPTKPAPADSLPDKEQKTPRGLPQNLTQALSTILAEKITSGQMTLPAGEGVGTWGNTSSPLSEEVLNESITQLSYSFSQLFIPPQINPQELKIISETNKTTIEAYAKQIVRVINENPWLTDSEKTDTQIIAEAIEQRNFQETDIAGQVYLARFKALKKVAIPAELISFHQGLLERLFIVSQIYQSIKETDIDPLKVMVGLERYQQIKGEIRQLAEEFIQIAEAYPE